MSDLKKLLVGVRPIRRGVDGNKAAERKAMHESQYPLDGGWPDITKTKEKPKGTLLKRLLYGPEGKK